MTINLIGLEAKLESNGPTVQPLCLPLHATESKSLFIAESEEQRSQTETLEVTVSTVIIPARRLTWRLKSQTTREINVSLGKRKAASDGISVFVLQRKTSPWTFTMMEVSNLRAHILYTRLFLCDLFLT